MNIMGAVQMVYFNLDDREGINRFYGPAQLDHIELFNFYYNLYKENIKLDSVQLHEKIDGYFFQFGVFEGDFFIKSSYSDIAVEENYKKVFYKSKEFIDIFECLSSDKVLQKNLKLLYLKFGNYVYKSELLFANKQIEQKDFIQIGSIKYKKELFGNNGLIVIFDGYNIKNKSYHKNDDLILPDFLKSDNINFLYNKDLKFEKQFQFDYESLIEHFVDYNKSIHHLQSNSIIGNLIKNDIDLCSKNNQQKLDALAEQHQGHLQHDNMPVEGLILAYKKRFFKGTTVAYLKNHEASRHFYDFLSRGREQLDKIIEQASQGALKNQKKDLISLFFNDKQIFIDHINKTFANINLDIFLKEIFVLKSRFFEMAKQFYAQKNDLSTNFYNKNAFESKKLAFYINLCLFDSKNIEKLIIFYLRLENLIDYDKIYHKKADLWIGRAQPWHSGHNLMIKNSENVVIHFVLSKVDENNPLSGEERYAFVSNLYKNNQNVFINKFYTDSAYLPSVFSTLFACPFQIESILCGPDRIDSYQQQLEQIDSDFFEIVNGFYLDFSKISIKQTERTLSGTQVRYRAKTVSYEHFKETCYLNMDVDDDLLQQIYLKLRQKNEFEVIKKEYIPQQKKETDNKRKIRDIIVIT